MSKKRYVKPDKKRGSHPRRKVKTIDNGIPARVARYGNGLYVPIQRLMARTMGLAHGDNLSVRVHRGGIYAKKVGSKIADAMRERVEEVKKAARPKRGDGSYANAAQLALFKSAGG